jgi:signal transduction histidine kinase
MEAGDGARDVHALLEEQAALRRVATLVAAAGEPSRVFSTVTEEVGRLLGAQTANMVRYGHDGTADVIGGWNEPGVPSVPVGVKLVLDSDTLTPKIERSGRPERVDDFAGLEGTLARRLQALGIRAGVGAPIVLDGELWGAVVVSSVTYGAFAPGDEYRVAAFTELVAQALANGEARQQLAASRARVVSAGDAERRRLERNLHDGAQQRLVTLAIGLRIVDRLMDEDPGAAHEALRRAVDELGETLSELRELARGLHPAVLTDHGLEAAALGLAQRAPVPVELVDDAPGRPSDAVEVAAYYVISESLTNVAKYAGATHVRVEICALGDRLLVEVADDGVGGAVHHDGSGLRGLEDRVEALGGRLHVESPVGQGTSVRADLPFVLTVPAAEVR